MYISNLKLTVLTALFLFTSHISFAQDKAVKSPKAVAEGKNVKVTYGQPSKRDRVIFGGLVPYGEFPTRTCRQLLIGWCLCGIVEQRLM